MKDSSVASEQLKQLRNKLDVSTKARDQLEKTYDAQFTALSSFVNRLANVAKGIDLELDNKLAKLRKLLDKKPDLDKIQPQLDELNSLLNQHSSRIQKQMISAQQMLQESGKKLQRVKGLPDQLRRDLRSLLKGIESPPESMMHYIVIIDKLSDMYLQALNEKAVALESGASPETRKVINDLTDHLHKEIIDELQNLLGELAFSDASSGKINDIRKRLFEGIDHNQLLECCLVVIKVIVQNVTDERSSAESFLGTLSNALSNVHKAVSSSLSNTADTAEKKQQLNQTLRDSVSEMSTAVEQAEDTDGLKSEINSQLNHIVDALDKKEQLEKDEQIRLLQMLESLRSKLQEMEKQAGDYRKKLAEQTFKSLQDPLTKLPNRAALDERLDLEFGRWQRYKKPLCLAVVDIDFFKRVNDTFGHAAGDKTLQVVAKAISGSLRKTDFVARYGGEEFIIVMPETSLAQAKAPLETLRKKIAQIPFKFKQSNLNVTISIGLSEFSKDDSKQQVFDRADAALYKAKESGRNRLIVD